VIIIIIRRIVSRRDLIDTGFIPLNGYAFNHAYFELYNDRIVLVHVVVLVTTLAVVIVLEGGQ